MEKVTVLKRKAHLRWLEAPSAKNFQDLKCSKAEAQRAARSASKILARTKLDNIPPDIIKAGKPALVKPLHDLLCQCWNEGEVPQDMRDAKIITLYKNKGSRSDCNNYRGISLLSIVGKVFAKVALGRLQLLANRIYPESQCGFRAKRSTLEMIFSVHQL
nr:uncharacterized protein LOC113823449 [Penaeus vannamei]